MCNDVGVMIDDGSQFQEKAIDLANGINYRNIMPWAIRCQPSARVFAGDEEGCEYIRITLKPSGDDADSGQPDITVYVDLDDWNLFKFAIKDEIRRYRRDKVLDGADAGIKP